MTDKIRWYFDHIIVKDKAYQWSRKATREAFEIWQSTTDKEQRKLKREDWNRLRHQLEVTEAEWLECHSALMAFDMVEAYYDYCDQVGYYDASGILPEDCWFDDDGECKGVD